MLVFGGMWKTQGLCTTKATVCCKCGLMNHPRKSFAEEALWTMWAMEVVQEVSVNYFSSNGAREHSCDISTKYVFGGFLALSKEFSCDYWKFLTNFVYRKTLRELNIYLAMLISIILFHVDKEKVASGSKWNTKYMIWRKCTPDNLKLRTWCVLKERIE